MFPNRGNDFKGQKAKRQVYRSIGVVTPVEDRENPVAVHERIID